MNENGFEAFGSIAKEIGLDMNGEEFAKLSSEYKFSENQIEAVIQVMRRLRCKKEQAVLATLLRMSRLPLTDPKTFDNFDFSLIHGDNVQELRNLAYLSEVYAKTSIALIGPPGMGKTHISKAIGRKCCEGGMKTYFLKATELREKLINSRRLGHEESVVNNLVKPTCLIIDEVGRCIFDKEKQGCSLTSWIAATARMRQTP